jgi:cytochrome c-type biogenesis protein CcmH
MILFVSLAALLVIAALTAVVVPLLKTSTRAGSQESSVLSLQVLREQLGELEKEFQAGTLDNAQYEKERAEIERRAIEDGRIAPQVAAPKEDRRRIWLAGTISAGLVVMTVGLYLLLGTPETIGSGAGTGQQQNSHAVTPQQIQAMVARLAERLQDNPADGEGWLMLARSYNALGRFPEASAAFGRATSLLPPDAQILADYADTLAMAQGRRLGGEPEKVIRRALQADPNNVKALALSGSVAFERNDFAAAIAEWRKILALVPPDSTAAERIRSSIADAESRSTSGSGTSSSTAPPPSVRGIVSVDSLLRAKVDDNATVFVFASAVGGSKMPLAITRLRVKDLPARFALDDSMGTGVGPKLSEQTRIIVGARISRSGEASPRPGDLEGFSEPIAKGSDNVRVSIAREVK